MKDLSFFYRKKSSPDGRDNMCKVCADEYCAELHAQNPLSRKEASKRYREKHRDYYRLLGRIRYQEHKQEMALYVKRNRKKYNLSSAKYRKKNLHKRAVIEANHRAQKLNATPRWANEFFISEAYHLAKLRTKMLGYPWHVDHIVPLKSKFVCGLHVENNLQVIPAVDNFRKHNSYWPDMP